MTEETQFALALERPGGADREAFLDEACGGDGGLRDRVARLLAADERSRGILEQGPGTTPFGEGPGGAPELDPPGYELAERVGEGGMGVVYRARDTRLHRDVAVKFLRTRFAADGPAARRFLGEVRVTAQLQHPGVPPIHQVGELPGGRPFLVMKLIRGRTLAEWLADEAADRGRLVAAFEPVCQAVAFAHSRRVIHRDLKPANVMVGAFGEVQVMDWGLAKDLASRERERPEDTRHQTGSDSDPLATPVAHTPGSPEADRTTAGAVLGTPAYMPPEQATGAGHQVDERSDVFGLGAILCAVRLPAGGPGRAGRRLRPAGRLRGRPRPGRAVPSVPVGGEGGPAGRRRRGGAGGGRPARRGRRAGAGRRAEPGAGRG